MQLITHNNINCLLEALINDYQNQLANLGAFDEYTIAVPNQSVANWLNAEIVKRVGISSGIRFESLYTLLNMFFRRASNNSVSLADKQVLSAAIYKLLSKLKEQTLEANDELAVLEKWLAKQNQAQPLARLCLALADVFELYQIYRPDWLDAWRNIDKVLGSDAEHWQAALWRLICAQLPENILQHRAQLTDAFKNITDDKAFSGLSQLAVFGVNQLDAQTLAQLNIISSKLPVSYFYQTASNVLFGRGTEALVNEQLVCGQQAYFSGNPLLASWAGLCREQALEFKALGIEQTVISKSHSAQGSEKPSILKSIQHNITANDEHGIQAQEVLDSSLSIHAHFSRYREVEGLHDYLLEQFNNDEALKPHDVIVLCPDINAYAPFIKAVFENQSASKIIPYQACGVNAATFDVLSVITKLIELPNTRYELSEVLDLLSQPVVQARFDVSDDELEHIHSWFKQANAYWGLDKLTLKHLDLPEYDRYTLQSAVDRTVLGLSLDGCAVNIDGELLYGIEGVTALHADTLSKLIAFMDALTWWRDICLNNNGDVNAYTAEEWAEHLRMLTESFIAAGIKQQDALNTWHRLLAVFEQGLANGKLSYSYAFVKAQLEQAVDDANAASSVYRFGRCNIGSFGALKGVPAKVIAVLGLNEADFPRKPAGDSINLVAKYPRMGDRNQVEQDKGAFLMALLNCQSRFYCSYIAKDIRSNSVRIPSLVLQELLDFIQPDEKLQQQLIIKHPMKAYSAKYFQGDANLYTYQDFQTQSDLANQLQREAAGVSDLPAWEMPEQITVPMLKAFLEDPAKAFFKLRFNVDLPELEDDTSDEEPMSASPLTRWQFIDELLQQGIAEGEITSQMIEATILPYQASASMEHDALSHDTLRDWAETAREVLANALKAKGNKQAAIQPVDLSLNVEGESVQLVGDISVFGQGEAVDIIHLAHKEGRDVSEKYLMRALVDTRIAEALTLKDEISYSSSYLACKNNLYQLQADSQTGTTSLEAWLGLYKAVMNAPISLDIVTANKMSVGNDYRDAFAQVLEDAASPYANMHLSKAMSLLSQDPAAVARGEGFVEYYQYKKPSKKVDEDTQAPQWIEVKDGATS